MDRNSMLYWWGLVRDASVPKPKTIIVRLEERDVDMFFRCYEDPGERGECREFRRRINRIFEELKEAVESLGGYPVFLRTDYTSGKHYSYVNPLYWLGQEADLWKVWPLICECHEPFETGVFAPPRPHALVVREWLDIERWTDRLPRYNTVEARLFIRNGEVEEVYPYYHWSGIIEHYRRQEIGASIFFSANPAPVIRTLRREIEETRRDYEKNLVERIKRDLGLLVKYGRIISERIEGYWSVDFVLAGGEWYFIDMAVGEASWKPRKLDETDVILTNTYKAQGEE